MSPSATSGKVLDRKVAEMIERIFLEDIRFNHTLGLKIAQMVESPVRITLDMRDGLIGNYTRSMLHGGVISSCLDVAGGLAVFRDVALLAGDVPAARLEERLAKIGTIDMRVDFLRPGQGESFYTTGSIVRTGRRVSVARMELYNDKDKLIAAGTGAYAV